VPGDKKWLMKHDGSYGPPGDRKKAREERKKVSEAMVHQLIEHYAMTRWRALFADAKEQKLNRHDMSDAYLLAMQRAEEAYALHSKTQLPRRRPGEQRADCPLLTETQRANGGTIRVFGVDPGLTNMGMCLVELVAQQLPPRDKGVDEDKPEPLFRLLTLQL